MENTLLQNNPNSLFGSSSMGDDYMLQKKFELMLDMNNKKMAAELTKLNSMITKLTDDFNDLKGNVASGAVRTTRADPVVAAETQQMRAAEAPPVAAQRPARKEEPVSPRCGNYTPNDVSIEKYFYFGNKKR